MRRIATAVDWPCEVHTLFRDRNLGCMLGPAQGISWFFEHEAEGIVLEDDILPVPSFFDFCDELLTRYRDNPKVTMISGCNLIEHQHSVDTSYFFSIMHHIWGWASWRRAWAGYDVDLHGWPDWRDSGALSRWLGGRRCQVEYWSSQFDRTYRHGIDAWDYQWTHHCWRQGGLSVMPAHSLITNLGFGPEATHTVKDAPNYVRCMRPRDLQWPLTHPNLVSANDRADQLIQRHVFGLTHGRCLRRAIRAKLRKLFA